MKKAKELTVLYLSWGIARHGALRQVNADAPYLRTFM